MPISEYLRNLRTKIGHTMVFMPGVTAVILNEAGEILLQRRVDDGEWGLVSGSMDPGEEPAEAIAREVFEETSMRVIPERVTGLYTGPEFYSQYPNQDIVLYLDITFYCRPTSGQPRVNDEESLAVQYFPLNALPRMHPIHLLRIGDALANNAMARFKYTLGESDLSGAAH